MFDEHNTKDWQQDGNGVFLLQECDPPSRRSGHPDCENAFSISVQSKGRSNRAGEVEIAKQICGALNGKRWQAERPTAGKWWAALHPAVHAKEGHRYKNRRVLPIEVQTGNLTGPAFWVDEVFPDCLANHTIDGALWLPRETPADPFAQAQEAKVPRG